MKSDPRERLVSILLNKKWIPQKVLNEQIKTATSTHESDKQNQFDANNTELIVPPPHPPNPSSHSLENIKSDDTILQHLDSNLLKFQQLVEKRGIIHSHPS
jgi:hypothetical protein